MNILVNLSNNLTGGSLQVAISFIYECNHIPEHIYHVVLGDSSKKQIDKNSFGKNFFFYEVNTFPLVFLQIRMGFLEKQITPDIVFSPFGPCYWKPCATHVMGFANAFYITKYDYVKKILRINLIELFLFFLKKQIHIMDINRCADVIICETSAMLTGVKKIFLKNKQFFLVSNNCNQFYFEYKEKMSREPIKRFSNNFSFITITTYRSHKNLEKIPLILNELKKRNIDNIDFYLTLDPIHFQDLFDNNPHIKNLGPQDVMKCPELYAKCDALFLPTYLESFSASYPEAMIMEKPILTSDLPFAHSICEDAACYFDPDDIIDMTDCIERIITDTSLYEELKHKGLMRVKSFPTPYQKAMQYIRIMLMQRSV